MDEPEKEEEYTNYIIMRGRVRIFLRNLGKRVSDEAFEELNKKMMGILTKAAERAEKNRRSTVLPWDL